MPEKAEMIADSSTSIGNSAEDAAANYLTSKKHSIITRNWRTKYCEIDIVSQLGDTVYFTEVKYRKSADQGGGIAAITPKKQAQMKFAARMYAHMNHLKDTNMRLAAMDVTGQPPVVQVFIKLSH